MSHSRRMFLCSGLATAASPPRIRVGAMDGVLRLRERPEALEAAARLGLDAVQVECGKPGPEGLPVANSERRARYLEAARKTNVAIAGTVLGALHESCLKNESLAARLVADAIQATARLRSPVLRLPFFRRCATAGPLEVDQLVAVLRDLAPAASRANVTLGLENVLSAEENARILDRVGSPAVSVYYDVGNSTNLGGYDAPREIRWLGRDRICQIHFKDKGYLGEGTVDFPAVAGAIRAIGYTGFVILETPAPSGAFEADARRNLAYTRGLFG